ncbi:YjfB family protein [Breznakiellaceae bacterium SP9]
MEIESLSTDMSQARVQMEAALKVEQMVLNNAQVQSEELAKILNSAEVIADPNLGNLVDFYA